MKEKILATMRLPKEAAQWIKDTYNAEIIMPADPETVMLKEDVIKNAGTTTIFMPVRFKASKDVLSLMPNLKVIANLGSGFELVDTKFATECKIPVINSPISVINPTAELTIALILEMVRRLPVWEKILEDKKEYKAPMFPEGFRMFYGKKLGIAGFGRIGKAVAQRALAFGAEISYYDPFRADEATEQAFKATYYPSIQELMTNCDIVTFHLPYNESTHHMVNKDTLQLMKDESYVVNMSRGPIFNENDVADALDSGKLAGAALDVHEFEPKANPRLLANPNVVLTPHVGTCCHDARIAMIKETINGCYEALSGKQPYNVVNKEIYR